MKTYQPCLPCIMKLMTSTLENSTLDKSAQNELLLRFEKDLRDSDLSLPPARTAGVIYQQVLKDIGEKDLFLAHKRASIKSAAALYPRLKNLVRNASDPIDAAIRVSALGNILDIANPNSYDLDHEISNLLEIKIRGNSMIEFKERVKNADFLLLLADNAGEVIFDKVLIETLELPVKYAVKSAPAFDDALLEDAREAGIDQIGEVLESGTPYPGTHLTTCSQEFQDLFQKAPLILAKGQANYETLNDVGRDLFFLLKVKCEIVSEAIGYDLGSLTLKYKAQS